MTEIQLLHLRWHEITGEDMPLDIASQPIELIRKAVQWRKRGILVAVPKKSQPVNAFDENNSSLRDWDGESNN